MFLKENGYYDINIISDNASEFNAICQGVTSQDLSDNDLVYSRNKDKTDKSLDIYKFYIIVRMLLENGANPD